MLGDPGALGQVVVIRAAAVGLHIDSAQRQANPDRSSYPPCIYQHQPITTNNAFKPPRRGDTPTNIGSMRAALGKGLGMVGK